MDKVSTEIEVGDHVTIGKSGLTWGVTAAGPLGVLPTWFVLRSGQSGRARIELRSSLKMHTKGIPA